MIGCEMDAHSEKAFKYRQKAEDIRAMVHDMMDQQSRDSLERIAVSYDELAAIQDNLASSSRSWHWY